ncbi:MAG: amino acid adenylation domain-containing protein [Clostridia bacterium]|nr:amino acid adenylation domain-containing protein [Clostridia bacterium]
MQINILEYFEKTVARVSAKTAVIDGEKSIDFATLAQQSKKLSRVLAQKAGVIRRPIAVYMPKCIGSVVSDMGIIYSGNAYMNLDVKTPAARISAILERIDPVLLITDAAHESAVAAIWPADKTVVLDALDFAALSYAQADVDKTLYPVLDTDPLCIINTSGSTGVPKGVVLNHHSFIDFTDWANTTMGFSENEVMGCLSPIVFDIYSYELCLLMSRGGTMVLLQESMAAFPARILQTLIDNRVTFIFWVPTIMVNIANMGLLDKLPLPDIKTVWFAGEVFPTKQFNIWRRALEGARFVNMYGPIEITLDCTHYIVERDIPDDEPIPIGYAMRNTDILILNEENRLCAPGEEGELCVRGSSLAMGYYNNPEKTAAAFVQNPLNTTYPETIYRTGDVAAVNERGEIVFRGRKDTLVKHSGYRIELAEIEHVIINTLKLVENGCIVYDHAKKEIVFFYEGAEELPVAALRKQIGTALPKYMIPTVYVRLESMPRNTNGKIDRLALKERLEA